MKKIGMVTAVLLVTATSLSAQIETPRVSQHATVSQTIGTTEIAIEYHRPGVRERRIWDGLVPYGQPWRMGANEATTISFSTEVSVEGQKVPAGTYSLFAIPSSDTWTIVINKDPNQWGAYGYDQEKDALRVNVQPVRSSSHTEWMRFTIDPADASSAVVNLEWENLRVPIEVDVDVDQIVWSAIDQALASAYLSAAAYSLDNGSRHEEGLEWVNASIEISGEGISSLWTRARLLHHLGQHREAMRDIDRAIEMAEGNVPDDFMNILAGTRASIQTAMN